MKLVLFDVDGTLVDSQAIIHACMEDAFSSFGYEPPQLHQTRSIVGLSLDIAIAQLLGRSTDGETGQMTAHYKRVYLEIFDRPELKSPLFPGVMELLEVLNAKDEVLLGLVTGKSRAGINRLLDEHGFHEKVVTSRCADDCPSKPHPAMVNECCDEVGIDPANAFVIGDTTFDMEMARSAGATPIGVSWGYHEQEKLTAAGAMMIAPDCEAIASHILKFEPVSVV